MKLHRASCPRLVFARDHTPVRGRAGRILDYRRERKMALYSLTQKGGALLAALVPRARMLAWGGNAWHFIEFAIALGAGIAASSIALVGFGIDSLIESLAGF